MAGYLSGYLDYPDIGFAVLLRYEKKEYTFEAVRAIMDYEKSRLGFSTILAVTTKDNKSSQNLLYKIGLSEKGIIRPNDIWY